MWNYLVPVLSLGGRVLLYDGSPLYPNANAQLKLIEKYKYASSQGFMR